jgi:hypothetical protein
MQQAHQTTHRPVQSAGKPQESDTLKKMKGSMSKWPSPIRHLFAMIGIGEEKRPLIDNDLRKLLKDVQGKTDEEAAKAVMAFIPKLRGKSLKNQELGTEYNLLVAKLSQSPHLTPEEESAISHLGFIPPSST